MQDSPKEHDTDHPNDYGVSQTQTEIVISSAMRQTRIKAMIERGESWNNVMAVWFEGMDAPEASSSLASEIRSSNALIHLATLLNEEFQFWGVMDVIALIQRGAVEHPNVLDYCDVINTDGLTVGDFLKHILKYQEDMPHINDYLRTCFERNHEFDIDWVRNNLLTKSLVKTETTWYAPNEKVYQENKRAAAQAEEKQNRVKQIIDEHGHRPHNEVKAMIDALDES